MHVTVLALHRLQLKTDSFLFTTDIEVLDQNTGNPLCELDICCVPDGDLTIGEAKSANRLGKTAQQERNQVNKYFNLAKKLGATQVVFATYSALWRDETVRIINERFTDPLIKLTLWTKHDLVRTALPT